MRNLLLILLIFLGKGISAQTLNPDYDSTLAKSYGADDYGMKNYILVILKTGPNNIEDKAIRDSLFAGHFANMNRLANLGKLIVAGPLGKNDKTYRGIFILNTTSMDEAKELIETDPVIKSKVMDAELYSYYGSAALGDYMKVHKKIGKYKIM
jgi:uncharacterized protein YciI